MERTMDHSPLPNGINLYTIFPLSLDTNGRMETINFYYNYCDTWSKLDFFWWGGGGGGYNGGFPGE